MKRKKDCRLHDKNRAGGSPFFCSEIIHFFSVGISLELLAIKDLDTLGGALDDGFFLQIGHDLGDGDLMDAKLVADADIAQFFGQIEAIIAGRSLAQEQIAEQAGGTAFVVTFE